MHRTPAVAGVPADWPAWLPEAAVARFRAVGVERPWRHQAEAAEALHAGRHVALATGTASGKSLAYLMPVLAAAEAPVDRQPALLDHQATTGGGARPRGPGGRSGQAAAVLSALAEARVARRPGALYLAPTKALAHDQLRVCREIGPPEWRVTTLDGDSPDDERRFAREFATYVLTNPDMLHRSVLPRHERWRPLLASLRYLVVDEAHRYRGVFGAHVAAVLRRLRRLCHAYGADPVVCCASATTANAAEATALLTGVDPDEVVVVDDDASPRAPRTLVVHEPAEAPDDEAATLLAELVGQGRQTLAFVSSRAGAERVALRAQRRLGGEATVAAYRGGYLPHDRRALEQGLHDGSLRGVSATSALELGIDVSGMDAVVIAGLPATTASLWQQAGRAGRRGGEATVVVVPRLSPLDVHLTETPQRLLQAPVEAVVLHPDNPAVLGPHLVAAAQEAPLTDADERWFGPLGPALSGPLAAGALRRRPTGWFCVLDHRAVDEIDLRSSGLGSYEVIEATTGRVLGTCDAASADAALHPGAVHLHQGEPWLVDHLDHDERQAWVHAERTGYHTQPLVEASVRVTETLATRSLPAGVTGHLGRVEVTSRVHAFLRRDDRTGTVVGQYPLDQPERRLATEAVWFTVGRLADPRTVDGGLHAAEHALVGMLGAFAPCDRWDVTGRSFVTHPDTDGPTVVVWDRHAGGAGFARAGFERATAWVAAAAHRLAGCGCDDGCPGCCLSAGCDDPGRSLDPAAGAALITDRG